MQSMQEGQPVDVWYGSADSGSYRADPIMAFLESAKSHIRYELKSWKGYCASLAIQEHSPIWSENTS